MRINFNKKLIIGSLGITAVLALALSTTLFLEARSALGRFGQEFMTNTVRQFAGTVRLQNQYLDRQLRLHLDTLRRDIKSIGGLYVDTEARQDLPVVDPDGTARTVRTSMLRLGYKHVTANHDILEHVKASSGFEASIFQILPDKMVRVVTTLEKDGKSIAGSYIPADAEVFREVTSGKTYEGIANISGASYMTIYEPVTDADGKVTACLFVGAQVLTPAFRELIQSVSVAGNGYAYIFDSKGTMVVHPTIEGQSIAGTPLWDAIGHADNELVYYLYDGVWKYAYIDYFEPWDWHIAMSLTPEEMMLGADKTLLYTSVAIGLAGLLLATITLLLMIRALMKPLDNLSDVTSRIAEGDLDARADYDGDDAIGRTVSSVNTMVDSLKQQLGFAEGVLNGIPIPCGVVGPDFRMTWVNRQICELTGNSGDPESQVGKTSGRFFRKDDSHETLSDKAIKQNRQLTEEIKYPSGTGGELDIMVTTTPFADRDGHLLGSITFWQDLTEIRTQQRRIERQNEKIAEAAREADNVSEQVSSASEELSAQIEQSSRGADEQRRRADEAATAMEEMNASVLEVARNAADAAGLADDARGRAREGAEVVEEAVSVINRVYESTQELKKGMGALGEQAEGIGRVMDVISDIADQTNLLALNAAIEAARAGDAGRGFAVVADEVRKLAEKTMDATKEVGQAIGNIQDAAQQNIDSTERAAGEVNRSTELAQRSGEALHEIVVMIERTADQVRSIATAAEQQSAASEEINHSTEDINRIASETAEAMQQSAHAVTELAAMAQRLQSVISGMREE